MHYYNFNIGDYDSHTKHLTPIEDLIYRRLLDLYYLTEQPINASSTVVARRINMRGHEDEVQSILDEFFELTPDNEYINKRADEEIFKYHSKLEAASRAGKASAQRRLNDRSTNVQLNNKQETINNKQLKELEPQPKKSKGTRLDQSWELPDEWAIWAKQNRLDLNVNKTADGFKDYWLAAPGAKGVKADWFATWRNWVRNQKSTEPTITLREAPWQKAARLRAAEFSPRIAARDPNEASNIIDADFDFFTAPKETSNGTTDSSN